LHLICYAAVYFTFVIVGTVWSVFFQPLSLLQPETQKFFKPYTHISIILRLVGWKDSVPLCVC